MDELILPIDNEDFIEEMKKHACIYDVKCEDYKNAVVKANAWKSIAKTLAGKAWDELVDTNEHATYLQQLQRRWKSLRDCFGRSLRIAMNDNNRKKQRKPYIYAKQMNFLLPYIEHMDKEKVELSSWDDADDSISSHVSPLTRRSREDLKPSSPVKVFKREEIVNSENSNSEDVQDWVFQSVPSTGYKDDDPERLFLLSMLPSLKSIKPVDRLNVQIEIMQVLNKWIQSYNSYVSTTVHSNIVPEVSLEIDDLSS